VSGILEACERFVKCTSGMTEATFAVDDMRVRAVLYDFAVIGKAATGISISLRALHVEAS
jgi:uncharacterized protein with HEPN domain